MPIRLERACCSSARNSADAFASLARPAVPEGKALDNEIARLRGLGEGELRARWHTAFRRRAPPHLPRHLLFHILAYRLQADRLGELDADSRRLLDRIGSGHVISCTHKRGHWANVPLLGAPHKPTEKFRPVPPIASTIDHTGETQLGARDQSCTRPAIGTQTPWHDICWLRLSLGTSQKHFPAANGRRVFLLIKTMQ